MQNEQVEICAWETSSVCTYLPVSDQMLKVHRLTFNKQLTLAMDSVSD